MKSITEQLSLISFLLDDNEQQRKSLVNGMLEGTVSPEILTRLNNLAELRDVLLSIQVTLTTIRTFKDSVKLLYEMLDEQGLSSI